MGRRSRRRGAQGRSAPAPAAAAGRAERRRARAAARPKPPWHPLPLIELCALTGLVLCVIGFLNIERDDGRILLVAGTALASLAGLDTALREHFAGFKSHSTLLAALPGVLTLGVLFFLRVPWAVMVAAAAAAFGLAFAGLRRTFRRRAGL
jgi:hypothetical protein